MSQGSNMESQIQHGKPSPCLIIINCAFRSGWCFSVVIFSSCWYCLTISPMAKDQCGNLVFFWVSYSVGRTCEHWGTFKSVQLEQLMRCRHKDRGASSQRYRLQTCPSQAILTQNGNLDELKREKGEELKLPFWGLRSNRSGAPNTVLLGVPSSHRVHTAPTFREKKTFVNFPFVKFPSHGEVSWRSRSQLGSEVKSSPVELPVVRRAPKFLKSSRSQSISRFPRWDKSLRCWSRSVFKGLDSDERLKSWLRQCVTREVSM